MKRREILRRTREKQFPFFNSVLECGLVRAKGGEEDWKFAR